MFDLRRLPIIGDDIAQVGQAYEIWSQPCGPDPFIAVRAFFTYLPTLVWAIAAPDPLDMAFDRAGNRHRKIRKRKMRVSDVMQLPAPEGPGLKTAIFRFAQLGQRIGYYFLVADATSDFLLNWTTLTWAWSGCSTDNAPVATLSGATKNYGTTNYPNRISVTGPNWSATPGAGAGPLSVSINAPGPKTFSASVRASVEPFIGGLGPITRIYFTRTEQGRDSKQFDAKKITLPDGTEQWRATDRLWSSEANHTVWTGSVEYGPGLLSYDAVDMTAVGAPSGGVLPAKDLGHLQAADFFGWRDEG